jgi:hypothetical protein
MLAIKYKKTAVKRRFLLHIFLLMSIYQSGRGKPPLYKIKG